jgi:hypothetical protein
MSKDDRGRDVRTGTPRASIQAPTTPPGWRAMFLESLFRVPHRWVQVLGRGSHISVVISIAIVVTRAFSSDGYVASDRQVDAGKDPTTE